MLKVSIQHNREGVLEEIKQVNLKSIKSNDFYSEYPTWFNNKFIPSYELGLSSIMSVHCKTYGTLLGFSLLKHNEETKISNLSPMVDGVGITQALMDGIEFFFSKDYDIYIPNQAQDLIAKVKHLGFHHVEENLSKDLTQQHKFTKPKNISWI